MPKRAKRRVCIWRTWLYAIVDVSRTVSCLDIWGGKYEKSCAHEMRKVGIHARESWTFML